MKTFNLPDLGEGLPDAVVREWYVKEGDRIEADQPLVAMETAKALVDVPSPYTGTILKLHGAPGDTINTSEPLVSYEADTLVEEVGEDSGTVVGALEVGVAVLSKESSLSPTKTQTQPHLKASPAVRALAKKLNVNLTQVKATGPGNMITATDVQAFIEPTSFKTIPISDGSQPLSAVRRAMAASMVQSHHTVVPVTIMDDADLSGWSEKQDVTIRLIQAIIAACEAEPMLNAHLDGQQLTFRLNKTIHLGIAVDTAHGLYVPVLKDIAHQNRTALRENIERLKIEAEERRIAPNDLHGATIMLSNFGVYAGRYANPIVIPPMVAIIGVGRARDEMVVRNGNPEIHRMLPLSLSVDHRGVTGGEAARFLQVLMAELAKPYYTH
ncbi:MAG TPA: dihydrolipoamide acetyltransferase family protein [Coxiellaceae bacterium]|nr:dihydrolipoamide acetyltransferase family protein [Coxiellaceae bacterium]